MEVILERVILRELILHLMKMIFPAGWVIYSIKNMML